MEFRVKLGIWGLILLLVVGIFAWGLITGQVRLPWGQAQGPKPKPDLRPEYTYAVREITANELPAWLKVLVATAGDGLKDAKLTEVRATLRPDVQVTDSLVLRLLRDALRGLEVKLGVLHLRKTDVQGEVTVVFWLPDEVPDGLEQALRSLGRRVGRVGEVEVYLPLSESYEALNAESAD